MNLTRRHQHGRLPRRFPALAATAAMVAASGALIQVAEASTVPDDTAATEGTAAEATATESTAEPSSLLAQAREEGITIGIANERPYGFEEAGEATGEAPAVAREVFSRLGIEEISFEVLDFGALINGLNAGRVDVVAAGMFITPDRAEQVSFADPDYCATTAFAVPEGNPEGLSDFESIIDTGVTLGVLAGAVEEGYALDSGVPEGQVSAFQTTPDVFDALDAGRIDAVALTAITVRAQVADLEGFEATEGFVPVIDGEEQLGCGGFAFRYENEDFRNEFNDVLTEMKANDEILPLIEEFGFTQAEVDAAADVTVEDLIGAAEPTDGTMADGTMADGTMADGTMADGTMAEDTATADTSTDES